MSRAVAVAFAFVLAGSGAAVSGLEDPTRPPRVAPQEEEASNARELTAILGQGDARVAVIDGRRVRVGDALGLDVVARIHATSVELTGADGPITLTLFGPPVKKPVEEAKEVR